MFARRCVYFRNRPQLSATVRNRSQPSARAPYGRAYGKFLQKGSLLEVSHVGLLRFASKAWHFVTFRRVESRFVWQAQYFGDVFRRCVLWTCPFSICVGGAIL